MSEERAGCAGAGAGAGSAAGDAALPLAVVVERRADRFLAHPTAVQASRLGKRQNTRERRRYSSRMLWLLAGGVVVREARLVD